VTIYEKIQACRASIKASSEKKAGWNEYSKYPYYTPEQVDRLVHEVCVTNKLFNKFDLKRNEYGIYGVITVVDLETSDTAVFEMASAIPKITATNDTQQLGGAMTYTNRYLLQSIYGLVDNNVDPDAQYHGKKGELRYEPIDNKNMVADEKPWLNETDELFGKIKAAVQSGKRTIADIRKKYKVSKKIETLLTEGK